MKRKDLELWRDAYRLLCISLSRKKSSAPSHNWNDEEWVDNMTNEIFNTLKAGKEWPKDA